jgi:hypothetical protein
VGEDVVEDSPAEGPSVAEDAPEVDDEPVHQKVRQSSNRRSK